MKRKCQEMQMLEKICWMRCECLQYASNKKVGVVVEVADEIVGRGVRADVLC